MKSLTIVEPDNFCRYYQAHVLKEHGWFVVAILKSYDHLVLVRTLDVPSSIFEFFVPVLMETTFMAVMNEFVKMGIVNNVIAIPNRLIDLFQEI